MLPFSSDTEIRWSEIKNKRLKQTRKVSFDEILADRFVGVRGHPKRDHQFLLLVDRKGYIWAVPFVKGDGYVFLKTLYPSRYWTAEYKKGDL